MDSFEIINHTLIKFRVSYNKEFIHEIKKVGRPIFTPNDKSWIIVMDYTNSKAINKIIENFSLKPFSPSNDIIYHPNNETAYKQLKTWLNTQLLNFSAPKLPRQYQIDGIINNLYFKKCINGSDMGTGKTLTSIFTVTLANLYPCLVITPNSVKLNWERQFREICPDKRIQVIDSKSEIIESDVYIINYDILYAKKSTIRFPQLLGVKWSSMICDESHVLKNSDSIRTKIVNKISKLSPYVFLLTGTPVMNRPKELISQLRIIDRFDELFNNSMEYLYRYCDAHKTRYGLDASGSSNIDQLSKILRTNCYYRVDKREVLTELPPIQETVFEVELENSKEYTRAKNDLILYLRENQGQLAANKAAMAESLVLINTLRKLSVKGKVNAIKDWIDNFLESTDRKLVVFGVFNETLIELADHYDANLFYGGYNAQERQLILEWFMINPDDRVLFLNIFAGGTGIDGLQNVCSDILTIDLPWRSTDLDQAVSRIERDGVKSNITSNFILASDSIDRDMWDMINEKRKVVDKINKGESYTDQSIVQRIINAYL